MKSPPWRTAPPWSSAITAAFASHGHGPRLQAWRITPPPGIPAAAANRNVSNGCEVLQPDQTYTVEELHTG